MRPNAFCLSPVTRHLSLRREPLWTQFGFARFITAADCRPGIVNDAAESVSIKGVKWTSPKGPARLPGNKMISSPNAAFIFYDFQNVLSAFPFPSKKIFFSDISDHIGQAAPAATVTFNFLFPGRCHVV